MKLSKLLVFAALFTTSVLSASNTDPNLKQKLNAEMQQLFKGIKMDNITQETFFVNFIVNTKGEILVTGTSNEKADQQIKDILNYKKINVDGIKPYEVYTLPVKVK